MFIFSSTPFSLLHLAFPRKSKKKFKNFYLTFTDAFIALLQQHKISKENIILIPDFYCPATLKIFSDHLKVRLYKTKNDFTIDKKDYFKKISRHKPKIILNYGYLGFYLSEKEKNKLKNTAGKSTIIIEDCAHRILNDNDIRFINKNHFYINSCRKHSPFFGSHVIAKKNLPSAKNTDKLNVYKIKLRSLQFIEQCLVFWAHMFSSKSLYKASEKIFQKSDALAGANAKSTKGSVVDYCLYNLLDLTKIRNHKKKIAKLYNEKFAKIQTPQIKTIENDLLENAELNYYPLFVDKTCQNGLISYLEKHSIFADRLWESSGIPKNFKNKLNVELFESFIIFPLNWSLREKDVEHIARKIDNFFKEHIDAN